MQDFLGGLADADDGAGPFDLVSSLEYSFVCVLSLIECWSVYRNDPRSDY